MRRRRNPRSIPPWVIQLAVYAGAGFLVYKFGKGLLDKFTKGAKDATKPLADAIVGKSTIEIASGITYQLPNGTKIKPSLTQAAGGAYITYLGKRYKLTAASPPGSGNYLVVNA